MYIDGLKLNHPQGFPCCAYSALPEEAISSDRVCWTQLQADFATNQTSIDHATFKGINNP
jgi:hypothetical protein